MKKYLYCLFCNGLLDSTLTKEEKKDEIFCYCVAYASERMAHAVLQIVMRNAYKKTKRQIKLLRKLFPNKIRIKY